MLQDIGSKTLRALPDVFFVRSNDGAWLRNSVGSFFIRGAQSYELVRALLPQLDGSRTVDEVCGGLAPERRKALQNKVLEPLLRNGFLFEVRESVEPAPSWIDQKYREHIAFLERYVDRPLERLLQIRSKRVVCVGSGMLLRATIVSLAELGFARVNVFSADADADFASLSALVAAAAGSDESAEWELAAPKAGATLADLVGLAGEASADAILIATTAEYTEIGAAIAGLREDGPALGIVAPAGGLLLATPLRSDENWCWECLYRSVISDSHIAPAPPSAAIAAFQVGQRLFCRFAGPTVIEDRRLTTVDCRTLNIRTHTPRRQSDCERHQDVVVRPALISLPETDDTLVRPDVPTSHDAEESLTAQNRIIESIEMWTDRLTGPFLSVDEEDLAQLPLSASRCRVRAPGSLPLRPQIRTFECRAIAPREARNQVALWAAEWLAGELGRRWGDLHDAAFGVGWTKGEAIYRAWLAHSLRRFKHSVTDDHKLKTRSLSQSSVRTFLLEALSALDRDDVYISLGEAPTGPVIARALRHGETIGWGAGIDEERAIDHALADALAKISSVASSEFMVVAYPNPPVGRWTEALRRMNPRIHEHYTLTDAGHLLPFLDDRAHVVALEMKLVPHGGPVQ